MIKIQQTEHDLIGAKADIEALAQKENARILCISDSHGNASLFEQLILMYGKECDGLIFCGDGFRDLLQVLYEAEKKSDFRKAVPPVIAFVQGNNDPSSIYVTPDFSLKAPKKQILTVCNRNILIVHGHYEGINYGFENLGLEAKLLDANLIFYGHTHVPSDVTIDGYRFMNPGSITFPRGYIDAPTFAILTFQGRNVDPAFIQILDSRPQSYNAKIFTPLG